MLSSSFTRFATAAFVTLVNAFKPNPSQRYEAKTLPCRMPRRLLSTQAFGRGKIPHHAADKTNRPPVRVAITLSKAEKRGSDEQFFR